MNKLFFESIIKRLNLFIHPLLFCSVGLFIFYNLFYFLIIKYNLFVLNEEYIGTYIPVALSVLCGLILLKPKLDNYDFGWRGVTFWTIILSILLIALPIMLFQSDLNTKQNELIQLSNPVEINKIHFSNNFLISQYYIDTNNCYVKNFCTPDQNGYKIISYFFVPLKSSMDNSQVNTWLCDSFSQIVSNESSINSICNENKDIFLSLLNPKGIKYFSRIKKSLEYGKYLTRIKNNVSNGEYFLLKPEYGIYPPKVEHLFILPICLLIFSNIILFLIFILLPIKKGVKSENIIR